ncbi:hypothetical protein ACFLZW_04665 [Chloroflexota bacterium]
MYNTCEMNPMVETSTLPNRIARTTSDIFSPPSIFAVLGFAVGWTSAGAFLPGLAWGALYGFLVSLAPLLVVIYLLKTGRVGDLHIRKREERKIPYLASVFGAGMACAISFIFDGPALMQALATASFLGLSILFIVNQVWLISHHMTGVSMAVIFAGIAFGWRWGLVFAPLIPLVFFSRLQLRRHSVAQMVAGLGVGVIIVMVVVALGLMPGQ